ncbi:MAG: sialate O-acetylesterase [Planctomycetota bacterium]|jgi:sialate O-acetylesterase|nr:sialate O-acetylesterase [Planctomycetota bacterium]
MRLYQLAISVLTLLAADAAVAEVRVSEIFSSNMVLQRDKSVTVWGTADAGEEVTVAIAGQSHTTTARDGRWKIALEPLEAGGPHEMEVTGTNTIVFSNILAGDVWLCGGQSNMDYDMSVYMRWPGKIGEAYTSIAANSPSYRDLRVVLMKKAAALPDETAVVPVEDDDVFRGTWQKCSTEVTPRMSATGFVFAQRLQAHLKIPVGLIDANKGGSPVHTWYAPESLRILDAPRDSMRNMYNAMIRTYRNFPIRGVIWYQGESNAWTVESSRNYAAQFKAMIRGWRHDFNDPQMPFLFVQLAAYERNPFHQGVTYPILRDSQAAALELKHTGMAVAIDLGDPKNIHPPYKLALSDRLMLAARKVTYGEDVVSSGPTFKSFRIDGGRVVVTFSHIGSGLAIRDVTLAGRKMPADRLVGFQIAGSDEQFHEAEATIDGDTVVVSSRDVKVPVAVRYGWRGFPYTNLYNREGLPATPFRTDDYEIVINQKHVDLYNRRLYLPRELLRTQMTIEQRAQVAVIHDRHVTEDVEARIQELRRAYEEVYKTEGRGSSAYRKAVSDYNDYLKPIRARIGDEIRTARIFE